MKTVIQGKDAPAAIGTYSQAVRAGDAIRAAVGVASLPRGAPVEIDAILHAG